MKWLMFAGLKIAELGGLTFAMFLIAMLGKLVNDWQLKEDLHPFKSWGDMGRCWVAGICTLFFAIIIGCFLVLIIGGIIELVKLNMYWAGLT